MRQPKIAVLLTVHNRRAKTLACLTSLLASVPSDLTIKVYLVDDGSIDGTASWVRERFQGVTVFQGDGTLYWNRGMCKAFEIALADGVHDYYMWLNDDTVLEPDATANLVALAEGKLRGEGKSVVVVGTTRDACSGEPTYGGRMLGKWYRPLYYPLIIPSGKPESCDTMNGNCVLIPAEIVRRVGWLDPVFVHGMGDYDFGLRVRRAGFEIMVAPSFVGTCAKNPPISSQSLRSQSLPARWRRMTGPKRYPLRAWTVYARRHLGWLWPFFWFRPYVEVVAPWAFKRPL